jgi:hypothetical protein
MSEVALLRRQIELELEAMCRGLYGLSSGRARHAFIDARMNSVGRCQEALAIQIGEQAANLDVCSIYDEVLEREIRQ